MPDDKKTRYLSDRSYRLLKHAVQIVLPGVATLYFIISSVWHSLSGETVLGTLAAVSMFIGIVLLISARTYDRSGAKYDGSLDIVDKEGGPKVFTLNLHSDPEDLEEKKEVVFKIKVV